MTLPDGTAHLGVLRTYMGDLVKGKDPKARAWIAKRIQSVDADVLCLQEVEDQDAVDVFHARGRLPVQGRGGGQRSPPYRRRYLLPATHRAGQFVAVLA